MKKVNKVKGLRSKVGENRQDAREDVNSQSDRASGVKWSETNNINEHKYNEDRSTPNFTGKSQTSDRSRNKSSKPATREEAIEAGNRAAALFDFWMLSRAKRPPSGRSLDFGQQGEHANGFYDGSPPRARPSSGANAAQRNGGKKSSREHGDAAIDQYWQLQYGDKCPYNAPVFRDGNVKVAEKTHGQYVTVRARGRDQSPYLELPIGYTAVQHLVPKDKQRNERTANNSEQRRDILARDDVRSRPIEPERWDLFRESAGERIVEKPLPLPAGVVRVPPSTPTTMFPLPELEELPAVVAPNSPSDRGGTLKPSANGGKNSPPRSNSRSPERGWEPANKDKPLIREHTYRRWMVRSNKSPPKPTQIATLGILRWPEDKQNGVGPWQNSLANPRPNTPGLERLPQSLVQNGLSTGLGPQAKRSASRPVSAPAVSAVSQLPNISSEKEEQVVLSLRAALLLASSSGTSPSTFMTTQYVKNPQNDTPLKPEPLSNPQSAAIANGTQSATRPVSGSAIPRRPASMSGKKARIRATSSARAVDDCEQQQPKPSPPSPSRPTIIPNPSPGTLNDWKSSFEGALITENEWRAKDAAEITQRQERIQNLENIRKNLRERLAALEEGAKAKLDSFVVAEDSITQVSFIEAPKEVPSDRAVTPPSISTGTPDPSQGTVSASSPPNRPNFLLGLKDAKPLRKIKPEVETFPEPVVLSPEDRLRAQRLEAEAEAQRRQERELIWSNYSAQVNTIGKETGNALGQTLTQLGIAYPLGRLLGRGKFSANYVAYLPSIDKNESCKQVCLKIAQFQHNDPLMQTAGNSSSGNDSEQAVAQQESRSKKAPTNTKSAPSQAVQDEFLREIRAMRALKHSCILELIDVLLPPSPIGLVLELMMGGSLAGALMHPQWAGVSQQQKMGIMVCITRGLAKLHSLNFVHRDIKPHNILLSSRSLPSILAQAAGLNHSPSGSWLPVEDSASSVSPRISSHGDDGVREKLGWVMDKESLVEEANASYMSSEYWVSAKIADFGTAVQLPEKETNEGTVIVGQVTGMVGTSGYTAPEILRELPYGAAVDVFSYSVVMHDMFSSNYPTSNPLVGATGANFPSQRPALVLDEHPPLVQVVCRKAWQELPNSRPTMAGLCGVLKVSIED